MIGVDINGHTSDHGSEVLQRLHDDEQLTLPGSPILLGLRQRLREHTQRSEGETTPPACRHAQGLVILFPLLRVPERLESGLDRLLLVGGSVMTLALACELVVAPLDDGLGTPGRNSEDVIVSGRVRALLRGALEKPRPDAESCLLYTSPSPRDQRGSRMPSSA